MLSQKIIVFFFLSLIHTLDQSQSNSGVIGADLTFADIEVPQNLQGEVLLQKPLVRTQSFQSEPQIITERVTGQPEIFREELIEPIRQRVVIQPQINQRIEKLVPIFTKTKQQVNLKNEQLPIQFTSAQVPKDVFVAGDQEHIQTFVEPKIHKVKEVVTFVETPEKREVLDRVWKDGKAETKTRVVEYPLQPTKYVNQPVLSPIIEREKLNIKYEDQPDFVVENEPIVKKPVLQEKGRIESFQIPGDTFVSQTINTPYITKEHIVVDFNEKKTNFSENKPIVKPQLEEANRYSVNHTLNIPVEDQKLAAYPAKVNYKIPSYGYEYVEVQEEGCDPCCGCAIDVYDEVNLNGWGDYRPVKK